MSVPSGEKSLFEVLSVEDSAELVALRCPETGIPVWTTARMLVIREVMATYLYQGGVVPSTPVSLPRLAALRGLVSAAAQEGWWALRGKLRADIAIICTGAGLYRTPAGWFNRLSDHFALAAPRSTVCVEDMFSWRWPSPRVNPRVVSHTPARMRIAVRGRMRSSGGAVALADGLLDLVLERLRESIGWTPDADRIAVMRSFIRRKVVELPFQHDTYERMLRRVAPRLLMIEGACYGTFAALIVAARRAGIHVAEYQHGVISRGHGAYNYSPGLLAYPAFQETFPQSLLTYGEWWGRQLNAPVDCIPVGNPHREERVSSMRFNREAQKDVLLLSDGFEFGNYLNLAREVLAAAAAAGLRVRIRPHPLERAHVEATYGATIQGVEIDNEPDLYASLCSAAVVVSEVSTGLFEAVGVAKRVLVWNTPKSRFAYPELPFDAFTDASGLAQLLGSPSERVSRGDDSLVWADDWRSRYSDFVARVLQ